MIASHCELICCAGKHYLDAQLRQINTTGKSVKTCPVRRTKIFRLTRRPNQPHNSVRLTADEGRWPSSRACGEMRWTRELRLTCVAQAYGEVVWSWRRGAGVKLREVFRVATVARKPFTGESTKQAVKPLRREGRDAPPVPVCSCALSLCTFAHKTAGAASTRRSLRPQLGERFQRLGRTRAARVVESYLCTVIASEAKQSISPRKERMDCFASLAMTGSLKIESEYLRTACCLPSAEGRQWATPFAQQKCRRSLAGICC